MRTDRLIIAEYAANGMALVAILRGQKGPISKGWNDPENTITDISAAAAVTGNVGLAHAYCKPAPTMALDIDDIAHATEWLSARGVDLSALLDADDAVQIKSGRIGRAKLLYRQPADVGALRTVQIKGADGEMILEFRCASATGKTVQDILPPSIHPDTGQPYTWGGKGDWRQLPETPSELLSAWQAELAATPAPSSSTVPDAASASHGSELGPMTIKHLRSALPSTTRRL